MTFPARALELQQLEDAPLKDAPAPAGSHGVKRVRIAMPVNPDKKEAACSEEAACSSEQVKQDETTYIYGYYKPLAPKKDYPELLAKISTATPVMHGLYLDMLRDGIIIDEDQRLFEEGKVPCIIPEERLVIENGQITGTFSVEIPDFTPIGDQQPTTLELLIKNFIEAVFFNWYGDDDDGHKGNMGFVKGGSGRLDFDMTEWWVTYLMKGERLAVSARKAGQALTVRDWETFPCTKDAQPYHSPTNAKPGEQTLLVPVPGAALSNRYADPSQFINLCGEQLAHKQKFIVALRALLTFNKETLRARLEEYFGDIPLNYTSLPEEKAKEYKDKFPDLFNDDSAEPPYVNTDKASFVDFVMKLYQIKYDNLYRVVVYYMGTKDNGYKISLLPTWQELSKHPSYYNEIEEWAKKQNSKYQGASQYDLEALEQRYHKVWRDAFAPSMRNLLSRTLALAETALIDNTNSNNKKAVDSLLEKNKNKNIHVNDHNMTESEHMFASFHALDIKTLNGYVDIGTQSPLKKGPLYLMQFYNDFCDVIKTYYTIKELTKEDSDKFATELNNLCQKYTCRTCAALGKASGPAKLFANLIDDIRYIAPKTNFNEHRELSDPEPPEVEEQAKVDDAKVIDKFTALLFQYANSLDPVKFDRLVHEVIPDYKPHRFNLFSQRYRDTEVAKLLKGSAKKPGDQRLAEILRGGNPVGDFNKLLIKKLIGHTVAVYHPEPVETAYKADAFNNPTLLNAYTQRAYDYAGGYTVKSADPLSSTEGIALFYKTLFSWVDAQDPEVFDDMTKSVLDDYSNSFGIFAAIHWQQYGSERHKNATDCFQNKLNTQANAVAKVFLDGDNGNSTLNYRLFHRIVADMQKELAYLDENQRDEGHKLILQYDCNKDEHKEVYKQLLEQAQPYSNPPKESELHFDAGEGSSSGSSANEPALAAPAATGYFGSWF